MLFCREFNILEVYKYIQTQAKTIIEDTNKHAMYAIYCLHQTIDSPR